MVYLRALQSGRKSQLNLAHGTKNGRIRNEQKKQKPGSSEATVRVIQLQLQIQTVRYSTAVQRYKHINM